MEYFEPAEWLKTKIWNIWHLSRSMGTTHQRMIYTAKHASKDWPKNLTNMQVYKFLDRNIPR